MPNYCQSYTVGASCNLIPNMVKYQSYTKYDFVKYWFYCESNCLKPKWSVSELSLTNPKIHDYKAILQAFIVDPLH